MTRRTYFMLCWSFQLSLVCMLRNVRDDSMRGLGSEHLLRVHDSHFQLGCCSPTRAFLILCFALPLLEYSILIIASMLSFQKHAFYCGNVMQRAGPSLVALHRVASGMNNGCRQLANNFHFACAIITSAPDHRHSSPTSSSDLSDSDLCTNIAALGRWNKA